MAFALQLVQVFSSPANLVLLFFSIVVAYAVSKAIHNIYFHPLARFPGPTANAVSSLPKLLATLNGTAIGKFTKLHGRYGNVVRIAPNELSYTTAIAWTDVYGRRHGHQEMFKAFPFDPPLGVEIINAPLTEHRRYRRLMSPAFSDKALKLQVPLIQSYIDQLMQLWRKKEGEAIDLVSWYSFITFDVIGDMVFGEPFDSLKDAEYKPWEDRSFLAIKTATRIATIASFGKLFAMIYAISIPKNVKDQFNAQVVFIKEKVKKRLLQFTPKPDIISSLLRNDHEKAMMRPEIEANAEGLIVAGSETTSTLLSGATWHLLRNPRVLLKLVEEIRNTFKTEQEINLEGVDKLEYLNGVVEEALRMYPPIPSNLPRIVPEGGDDVDGKWLPAGTIVSVCPYAAFNSPKNFKHPDEFTPERWLGDPKYEKDNRAVFQPFSFGPRDCLGRRMGYVEVKLILARTLWNFDIELDPRSRDWSNQKIYILWEKQPLWVTLKPVQH